MEGEAGSSESLRRDCSCRGTDAGFVHLTCLAEYAEKKNEEWNAQSADDREIGAMREPWEVCPNCLQDYQNTLSADIANEFVSYVERDYPNDKAKRVEALSHKLWLLVSMIKCSQQNLIIDEAKEVASKVLALIQQMKLETLTLSNRHMQVEAITYNEIGLIAIKEARTDDGANYEKALFHFEKYLELSKAIDFHVGIANAECNIAFAKSMFDRCDDARHNEDRLKKYRDLYDVRVEKLGEGNTLAVNDGANLAIALWNERRGIEAERMLTRIYAVSRRVHGPRHKLTEKVESMLTYFQLRYALVQVGAEWKRFQVLRYIVAEDEYVVQGPIEKPRNIHAEERSNVAADGIRAEAGTPVVCYGLTDESSQLNGKIADLTSYCAETDIYEIHFEDERMGSRMIKLENIRILLNLLEK
jgi:hypothetical protein